VGLAAACATLLWATSVQAGLTARAKCEATKNQETGKYAACLQNATAALVKEKGTCSTSVTACYRDEDCPSGGICNKDLTNHTKATGKCLSKLTDKWAKAEAKAGGPCPDAPLVVDNFKVAIGTHSYNITNALNGGGLAAGASRLRTGQTQCNDGTGTWGSCPGTPAGQDGELQKGLARSYTDNGDGTITDNRTGLMWEKKDDNNAGGIHDWNNTYTWANAFVFVAALNTEPCFAGHCDWRVPNINELQSLADYGKFDPGIDDTFNTSCAPGCTVTTCSCTQWSPYWSSTGYLPPGFTNNLLFVDFHAGGIDHTTSGNNLYVRAVRGGL
jgi:hypothetical protein